MPKVITPVRFAAFLFFQAIATTAAAADDGLVGLSLEELLNIEVSTGSLLKNSTDDAPAAITIIRKDQIEISGAKNLANLLEQHVPGMMLKSHSEGDKIGLRGLIAAEDLALFAEQKRQFERERYLLDKTDSYKLDYALNVSLSYTHSLNKKADVRVKLFAENILHSKNRYNVSTGSNRFYPERFNFMVEPVAIGMSVTLDLN
ncbi:hypothetical protein QFX18_17260 [Saccharophagus degradans]|uniref:hypothetical protein n=1 Tax=Saccharophagus degradans TaxID=86304 RepID=UPI002477D783|nr:hypothetical protein [Saccharophagus degradans]WGO97761.1 hypothetical protein QFX18_17260 [Saccharophagus degradans]